MTPLTSNTLTHLSLVVCLLVMSYKGLVFTVFFDHLLYTEWQNVQRCTFVVHAAWRCFSRRGFNSQRHKLWWQKREKHRQNKRTECGKAHCTWVALGGSCGWGREPLLGLPKPKIFSLKNIWKWKTIKIAAAETQKAEGKWGRHFTG